MIIDIDYNLQALALAAFKDDAAADLYDAADAEFSGVYEKIFNALIAGEIDTAAEIHNDGATWYAFTRSLYVPGAVQRSAFWNRGGDDLPLSHQTFKTFDDMRRDGLRDRVRIETA